MTDGKIENGLKRGFVKHSLNYLLITDPIRVKTIKITSDGTRALCQRKIKHISVIIKTNRGHFLWSILVLRRSMVYRSEDHSQLHEF